MSFTFFIPHPSPGGDTTVNMTVWNTTCIQLSDNMFKRKFLTSYVMLYSGCGIDLNKQWGMFLRTSWGSQDSGSLVVTPACGCVCGSNWAALLKHRVAYIEIVQGKYEAIRCIFRKLGIGSLLSSFCGSAYQHASGTVKMGVII